MSYSNEFSRTQMSKSLHQDDQRRNGLLRSIKRVVIKLGTSTVTGSQGELSLERIEPIVHAIATLQANRRQVVLVSSGAVGLGRGWLGLHPSSLTMAGRLRCFRSRIRNSFPSRGPPNSSSRRRT